MTRVLAALTAAAFIFCGVPAFADVDVVPDDWSPSIHLEVEKSSAGSQRPPGAASAAPAPQIAQKIPAPPERCLEDQAGLIRCYSEQFEPPAEDEDAPEGAELTEGDILQAVQEIGLPSLAVQVEPGDSTLVNARTNFYTDPEAFARSVDLLGFDIDIEAEPVRYLWVHGDGTRASTSEPGRRYPNLDITHRYREPADVVRPRVDATYRVRYRVDGGAWATIGQTLTATGPFDDLEVVEAAPVLTAPK